MFVKDQTVVYLLNGYRATIKETPDTCLIEIGVRGKDPLPAYAVQFYRETLEGPVEDGKLFVAPRAVVEMYFRLPNATDKFVVPQPPEVEHYDREAALAFHNTGIHTLFAIRSLSKGPVRGTGAPIIQLDENTFEATPIRQRTRSA